MTTKRCRCGWNCTQPDDLEAQRAYERHWQLIHGYDPEVYAQMVIHEGDW